MRFIIAILALGFISTQFAPQTFAGEKKIKQGNFRTGSYVNAGRTLTSSTSSEALAIDARVDFNYFIFDKF